MTFDFLVGIVVWSTVVLISIFGLVALGAAVFVAFVDPSDPS